MDFDPKPDRDSKRSMKEEGFFSDKKGAVNTVVVCAIYFIAICFAVLFLVRILHFVLPTGIHWLTSDQVQNIDRFLFSGISGALIGKYVDTIQKG